MNRYKAVKINGKKRDLHRVVAEQKVGRKLGYDEVVHHEDEDKLNNNPSNLTIISRAEHSRLHGLKTGMPKERAEKIRDKNRERNFNGNLSVSQVKEVKALLMNGVKQREIAEMYGVSKFVICRINIGASGYWI